MTPTAPNTSKEDTVSTVLVTRNRAPHITDPAFPTLISGGYSNSPSAITNLNATINGPTGDNNWQVTVVNTSGQTVSFTVYTICAKAP